MDAPQNTVRLSLRAMATRFELVMCGSGDAARLRAAGEEALREIERLEAQLSFYRPDSEVSWINSHAADAAVKVEPRLFDLLTRCAALATLTDRAFDITVGPLMRAWRFVGGAGAVPSREEREAARAVTGIRHVEFDEEAHTIRFRLRGVEIDLGAYGKGYAVERALKSLRENGVTSALMHGGTSSVGTVGTPPRAEAWRVQLHDVFREGAGESIVSLAGDALSVSAIHGKSFTAGGRRYGHIIDPRSGEPIGGALATAVVGESPATCEALSTALLVLGSSWAPVLCEKFPGYGCLIASEGDGSEIEVTKAVVKDAAERTDEAVGRSPNFPMPHAFDDLPRNHIEVFKEGAIVFSGRQIH